MQCLNATVSSLVLQVIQEVAAQRGVSRKGLAHEVAQLSSLFTKERAALAYSYLDVPSFAAAYLNYFLPVNLAKIQVLLDEMPVEKKHETFSVLDLGSGPGTGSLAVLDWWHRRRNAVALSVVTLDRSSSALRDAAQLWEGYSQAAGVKGSNLQTYEADLERSVWLNAVGPKRPFDLVILANCLNEMYADATDPVEMRTRFVTQALLLLKPSGTMMIIEPALRETSRALHRVRDRLLHDNRCTIYSPCLHERNCPALVKPDDWCHEERVWEPPMMIQQIDEQVGFIKDALKFSYVLLRKDGKTIVERRPEVFRVVSELRQLKGEKRAWLCNEQGRQEVGRQDRLASPQNQALDQWHRGAIVQIEKIVHKERKGKVSSLGRIEQDAAVQIVRPVGIM